MRTLRQRRGKRRGGFLRRLAALPVLAAGAWIAYSKLLINHEEVLPEALDARRVLVASKSSGLINYYVDEQAGGQPLVLIHSVNAAASAFEMRPLFEHYRSHRTVFALELPGFGFSQRPDRAYSPSFYAEAILDFLAEEVGRAADVIALSLSSEFAALAALNNPESFQSLTLISPTGLSAGMPDGLDQSSSRPNARGLYNWLAQPLWAQALYDLIVLRPGLKYFLRQSFIGAIPPGMVDYAYATSHQQGARHAPLHFVSGLLFNRAISEDVYEKLAVPVLALYDQDAYTDFGKLPNLLKINAHWQAQRVAPSLGMPHFEQLDAVTHELDQFWQ